MTAEPSKHRQQFVGHAGDLGLAVDVGATHPEAVAALARRTDW
jgi:hypothetical protein